MNYTEPVIVIISKTFNCIKSNLTTNHRQHHWLSWINCSVCYHKLSHRHDSFGEHGSLSARCHASYASSATNVRRGRPIVIGCHRGTVRVVFAVLAIPHRPTPSISSRHRAIIIIVTIAITPVECPRGTMPVGNSPVGSTPSISSRHRLTIIIIIVGVVAITGGECPRGTMPIGTRPVGSTPSISSHHHPTIIIIIVGVVAITPLVCPGGGMPVGNSPVICVGRTRAVAHRTRRCDVNVCRVTIR